VSRSPGVASLERIEALLRNEAIYQLAELIPTPPSEHGGRPRDYPDYMLLVFDALLGVYRSGRQVEAELSHQVTWRFMRRMVRRRFPDDPSKHLPRRPMQRHHYLYGRNRYLSCPEVLEGLGNLHRELAIRQAREIGLLNPAGPGSWTHPHLSRMLYADGKVVAPLYRAKPGDTRVDKGTGEIRAVRHEPDARLHFEGDGEAAWGTKFVMVAVRGEDTHARVILDVERVPEPGGEAAVAMKCFRRLAPLVPGAQGVIYDTALRGVHHQTLLRDLGLIPVNRVTAARKGAKAPRRGEGRRVEKSVHLEDKEVVALDGRRATVRLFARGGAVGVVRLTETGEPLLSELERVRTHRNLDLCGTYRWYNEYRLPAEEGGGTVTVRLHGTDEDRERRLNRPENVRVIPPSDPDFAQLYARRNDAESINRALDDSLYLGRAHSKGQLRQQAEMLGYALLLNSLALDRHRQRRREVPAA
jgi:hypothetical protein